MAVEKGRVASFTNGYAEQYKPKIKRTTPSRETSRVHESERVLQDEMPRSARHGDGEGLNCVLYQRLCRALQTKSNRAHQVARHPGFKNQQECKTRCLAPLGMAMEWLGWFVSSPTAIPTNSHAEHCA